MLKKTTLHRYRFAFRHAGVEHFAFRFYPEKQEQETLDRDCIDWVNKYRANAVAKLEEQYMTAQGTSRKAKLLARIEAWKNG